jgi:hypothetical protein
MKETPPYSLVEIQCLLSQYLDGALEPERMVQIDALLEQFPQYRDELLKLQATRGLVHDALERQTETQLHYTKISDGVWKNILGKLKADQQVQPTQPDAEFISAYYDGEIPAESAELQAFESQLYGNAEANRLLAELGQVSETVRQFGYRLENACSLDISAQVMELYRQEQGLAPGNATAPSIMDDHIPAETELMSAYADQELSAREIIEANRLIESSTSARTTLGGFTLLSEHIQHFSTRLQMQAPDLWPSVHRILMRSPAEGGIVTPRHRRQKLRHLSRIAIPAAAAAVLLLFFMPTTHLHSANSVAKSVSINTVQRVAYQGTSPANATELASLPGATLGQSLAQDRAELAAPTMDSSDIMPAVEKRMPAAQPLKPILDPSPQIATKPSRATADTASTTSGLSDGKAPSSEEYLFNALNEQMPDEDVSTILGK